MPNMYLELVENKTKIKPELVNQEYVAKERTENREREISPDKNKDNDESRERDHDESKERDHDRHKDRDRHHDESRERDRHRDRDRDRDDSRERDRHKDRDRDHDESREREDESRQKHRDRDNEESEHGKEETRENEPNEDDGLSSRLRELMRDSNSKDERRTSGGEDEKVYTAPRLSEISGGTFLPKKIIGEIPNSFDDEDLKRELLFKFELLKKSYKNSNIPEFTIHSDYQTMQRTYDSTIRQVNVDNNIETYKSYLITGFYITEFVLGYWLKFDMQDFTRQQMTNMNKYEHLLIELGEKNYVPEGSKWPVEIRLLFTILINAAIFIITKMVMKKIGSNLFSMPGMNEEPVQNVPKRRMRGPDLNI